MNKPICPSCGGNIWRWRDNLNHDAKCCANCGHIRPTKHRTSKKRQQLEATLQELLRGTH